MKPYFPFHVAGGRIAPQAASHAVDYAAIETPVRPGGSRRNRLWEVSHKFHCPIIGVCFDVDELRSLMKKIMDFPRETTDFVLHTTAVGACEHRSRLAELLHKTLERRYAITIREFAAAKDGESLRQRWLAARESGTGIGAALWAAWSHPACNAALAQEIYGDIHMLQHQIGSGMRADLKLLAGLREENERLRQQLSEAQQEIEWQRAEKTRETARLAARIGELRSDLVGKDACLARQTGELTQLRDSLPELRERQSLARRASDAEARAAALSAHAAQLEEEHAALRQRHQLAGKTIELLERQLSHAPALTPEIRHENLAGKAVLCVGGRSGSIDAYREIIEQQGGRFLHHDGGLEDNPHRIEGALAAADLVICQAGCISHNAYWRVKEQCKRTGKPCIFMKNAGASGLARSLADNIESLLPEPIK